MSKDLYSDFRKFATDKKINGHYLSGTVLDDYTKMMINKQPQMLNYQSPYIYQTSPDYGCNVNIFSKMIENFIIFVSDFDSESADIICGQLLYLNNCDSDKDITMHINSYGGDTTALYSILDVTHYISNPMNTVAMGIAASCGACLLILGGDYGHRYAQPNSSILIHQPSTSVHGPAADIEITCNEITRIKKNMFQSIADRSGNDYETINKLAQRDCWLTAEQCIEYHFIDKILEPQPKKIITYNEWLATKD